MRDALASRVAPLGVLLLALAALVLPHLGAAPLERAEIYFLDSARQMVESGDWLVPRYQGEPFFDKPPLTYWLMASAFAALGPEPGPARLVPALSSFGVVLVAAWLGALLFDRRTALAGALVLATTLAFLTLARVAMSDMLLAFFTTLAVALAVRVYRPAPPRWGIPALGAVLGLGFATKGPIAVLVPGLALLVLLYQNRRRPRPFGAVALAWGAVAFVVLGLGWFVAILSRLGPGPLEYFFLKENLERFAGEAYDVGRPAWFYLPAYAAEGLPWSPFLPIALLRLLRGKAASEEEGRSARFLATWVGLVLVPLVLSRGKIDYYLLPLYPAVSILIGRWFASVPWRRLDRGWVRGVFLLFVLFVIALLVRPPHLPEEWLPGGAARLLLALALGASAVGALAAAVRPAPWRALTVLGGGMALSWLVLVVFFLPAFAEAQPNRQIAKDVARERRYRPDLRLAACDDPSRARRDVLFQARVVVDERCDLWPLAASDSPYLLLVGPDEDLSFQSIPGYRHVASYDYLSARALTLGGLLSSPEPGEIRLVANFPTTDPVAERKRRREYRKGFHEAHREEGVPVRLPRRRQP